MQRFIRFFFVDIWGLFLIQSKTFSVACWIRYLRVGYLTKKRKKGKSRNSEDHVNWKSNSCVTLNAAEKFIYFGIVFVSCYNNRSSINLLKALSQMDTTEGTTSSPKTLLLDASGMELSTTLPFGWYFVQISIAFVF